jgi:DNA-binding CsgD family transcriptional regulator/Tfp pilus assembly protein PilF
MKKYLFISVFIFFVHNVFSNNVKNNSEEDKNNKKIEKKIDNDPLKKLFQIAIEKYSNYEYHKAIVIWKEVLKKAKKKKDDALIINTIINIGSSYNALGYHKTALDYFIRANKKLIVTEKQKKDSYWTNHINIGVCYMSLEQFDLAKEYLEKTADYNQYIIFLKKLNLAKWHALQNDQPAFISYQKEVSQRVINYPIYEEIWREMQLDFFIKWRNNLKVKELLGQLIPIYNQQNLYLKLLINQGYLLVYNKTFTQISNIIAFSPEVKLSNDLYLMSLYYSVLKEHYFKLKDIEKYHFYSDLYINNNESLNKEKNMLHVEDYKVAQELEELKGRFSEIQLKNEIIENQLAKSKIRFILLVVIICMGLGIIFLIVRNFKKINSLNTIRAQNELLKKEIEKVELTENLKETSDELTTSILNIKKVALLKKQLENIVDEKAPSYNEKETLKKLKLCLNSFFDNYRELNQIMQKKLNVDKMIDYVKKDHPEITDKEIRVIEYIALHFTTKEIAILMGKSEKSIEYYRSQIRKKMQLSINYTLEEYLNSIVKS